MCQPEGGSYHSEVDLLQQNRVDATTTNIHDDIFYGCVL